MAVKIGLLECDHVAAHLLDIAGDYGDMFDALFARHAPSIHLEHFDVQQGELPTSVDACDGYLTTGSRFSAYDTEPWIDELKDFVRRLSDADKPFVGICFGHQVLAEAMGGKVTPAAAGWGIGAHPMKILQPEAQAESWMDPQREECTILYSHRDQVERLPGNSRVLASTEHCPIAICRVGEKMLGIQGHPEFTLAYAAALARGRREMIGTHIVKQADFTTPPDDGLITGWVVNFLGASI